MATAKKLQLQDRIKALQTLSRALNRPIDICADDAKSLNQCPVPAALETIFKKYLTLEVTQRFRVQSSS